MFSFILSHGRHIKWYKTCLYLVDYNGHFVFYFDFSILALKLCSLPLIIGCPNSLRSLWFRCLWAIISHLLHSFIFLRSCFEFRHIIQSCIARRATRRSQISSIPSQVYRLFLHMDHNSDLLSLYCKSIVFLQLYKDLQDLSLSIYRLFLICIVHRNNDSFRNIFGLLFYIYVKFFFFLEVTRSSIKPLQPCFIHCQILITEWEPSSIIGLKKRFWMWYCSRN